MFHNIYNDQSVIKLPQYLTPLTDDDRNRLRPNIRPPVRLGDAEAPNLPDLNQRRINRHDSFSLTCTIEANDRSFKNSFFFRTMSEWNDLPTELKGEADPDAFRTNLKKHLWEMMIDPD